MHIRYSIISLFLVFLILLSIVIPLCLADNGGSPYSVTAEAFFRALQTGNYSLVKPYLSPVLSAVFTEKSFYTLRSKLSGYGELLRYYRISVQRTARYVFLFYNAVFEKRVLTFKLVLDPSTAKLEGIWITGEAERKPPSLLLVSSLVGGAVLGIVILYLIVGRFYVSGLLLGMFIFFIALGIQQLVQQGPLYLMGIRSNSDVIARGYRFVVLVSLWVGFVAGVVQEVFKYLVSRGKRLTEAIYIGSGFGLSEPLYLIFILYITYLVGYNIGPSGMVAGALWMGFVERFLVVLFHSFTTLGYAWAHVRGWGTKPLIVLIVFHGAVDSMSAYYRLVGGAGLVAIMYVALGLSILLLGYYLYPPLKRDASVPEKPLW